MGEFEIGFSFDMQLETPMAFFDVTYLNGEKVRYERKCRGEWIDRGHYTYCSECNKEHDTKDDFCPKCGADMRGKK